ncbi:serine hydrolase [Thalassobacillus pellis]|uniref:serine hydrolase n=1 Tax=Thalassobacillus pellis TaxID=748008 RepID=UPI001EF8009E|nr:serine hydrolase [Thalassobacillus pellis]MBM7552215.1 D-alanyl-D-alanine carboxypeptidase (penicillin-binding protein 5/6) [Thalassobacillus pellis]
MKFKFKTSCAVILAIMITLIGFVQPDTTYAQVDIEAKSAILVDFNTGQILFEKEADLTLPPASMTKMMTEYLVLEAIEEGKISWDTTTQVSDYAYSISANSNFSGVGLTQSQDYTVRELYEAMAINSDNGTTIALAELVAGSEGEFVKMMNAKAKEMGLPDYKFVNSTGLPNSLLGENHPEGTEPDAENLLSARSAALLAYNLIKDYPEAMDFSSITKTEFDGQEIINWNWMLPDMPGYLSQFGYKGMDGMKTGYTELAGNCFTGTAERDGRRLISVIMKADSRASRFEQTRQLLDYGFNQFEIKEMYPAGHQLKEKAALPVTKGKEEQVAVETGAVLKTVVKSGEEENYKLKYTYDEKQLNKDDQLTAPVEKGAKVGTATLVHTGGKELGNIVPDEKGSQSVAVVTSSAVEKSNWFMLSVGAVGDFFGDIFNGAVDTVTGWF